MIEPTPGRARCRCCSDPTTAVGGVVVVVVWEPVPVLWWGWPQGSCRALHPIGAGVRPYSGRLVPGVHQTSSPACAGSRTTNRRSVLSANRKP